MLFRRRTPIRADLAPSGSTIGMRQSVRSSGSGIGAASLVYGLAGDVEVLFSARTNDSTAITAAGGWTVVDTHASAGMYGLVAWRLRGSSQQDTGMFTNATRTVLVPIYGCDLSAPITQITWDDETGPPISSPAMTGIDAEAWVLSGICINGAFTVPIRSDSVELAPATSSGRINLASSNGTVGTWAAESIPASGAGKNIAFCAEIANA